LLLVFARSWKYSGRLVFYLVILVLAVTYTWLLFADITSFDPEAGSSLSNIARSFGNERVALLGWIHYLAFDLLAGLLISMDGRRLGIHPALMFIPLFFTLMAGPFGILLYTVIRYFYTGRAEVPLDNL
ncbi:MAG: ABA4-like family protein, partial [Cyclobacteriaceae bacterium]